MSRRKPAASIDTRARVTLREIGTAHNPQVPGTCLPWHQWRVIRLSRETDAAFFGAPDTEAKIDDLEFPKYAWERVP